MNLLPLLALLLLVGCETASQNSYQGYAEGEYLRLAAPLAGTLTKLTVKRGDRVTTGDPLFALEQQNEQAVRLEANQRLARAEATLANLKKGRRPSELATIEQQLLQAQSALKLSQANLARQQQLLAGGFISAARLDEAQTVRDRDRARVAELRTVLTTARLGGRSDEISAAEAEVAATKAVVAQADWRLSQKSVVAPASGEVVDTLFNEGEWLAAGTPVLTLLPPERIKLRFFVPEQKLGTLHIGQKLLASCDGCSAEIAASVSYIAPQPEFTPPVLYNRENRSKLVFMVEARPTNSLSVKKLHPGQPLDIHL